MAICPSLKVKNYVAIADFPFKKVRATVYIIKVLCIPLMLYTGKMWSHIVLKAGFLLSIAKVHRSIQSPLNSPQPLSTFTHSPKAPCRFIRALQHAGSGPIQFLPKCAAPPPFGRREVWKQG